MPASGEMNPFLDGARELVDKLRDSTDYAGIAMLGRASTLAAEFESWKTTPPCGEKKSESISKLFDLTREVNEHLVRERDHKA